MKSGFTLIELIVVIAIIGVLSAIIVPNMVGYMETANNTTDAENARIISEMIAAEAMYGDIIPVLNDEILAEYENVLRRPKFKFEERAVRVFLDELKRRALFLDAGPIDEILPDPKDVVFYAVLMEKRKEDEAYLVTGNLKHFPIRTYIVTPKEMLDIISESKE